MFVHKFHGFRDFIAVGQRSRLQAGCPEHPNVTPGAARPQMREGSKAIPYEALVVVEGHGATDELDL